MVLLVCGILRRDGGMAGRGQVEAMLAAMNPAGLLKAADIVTEGPLGLGILALAPPPCEPPEPPRILATGEGWLTADIRLYGREDLGAAAEGAADDAVLAAGLAARGWRAPAGLHGDFAYARWDRASGVLELGRDHFGVRPLQYMHRRGAYVAFASLPGALLRTELASRELDAGAMRHFHVATFAPQERTFYREIRSVLAAHIVRFAPGRQGEPRRYWRLPIPERLPFDSDPAALAAETRRRLDHAVRRRLPPAGVGAGEMSGGLDSTPISVLAARAFAGQGRSFHGYSMQEARGRAELPIVDEAPDVAAAAAGEPNLTVVPVPTPGLYAVLDHGHNIDDFQPVAPGDPWNFLLRHAAASGAPVILSGWGGDEIVTHAGRGAFAELFWAGRWVMLHKVLRERARRLGGTLRGRFLWSVLIQSLPFGPRHWFLRLIGKDDAVGRMQAVRPPFLPRHRRGHVAVSPVVDGPDARRNRRGYAESWWMQKRLEVHAQQAARQGLAYAFPMLDLDLVEYVMRVPGIFFCSAPGDRSLIRAAAEGILPDGVRLRPDKLVPYPLESLRLAEGRPTMLEKLAGIEASRLVAEFVDVVALGRRLAALPDAAEVRAETAAAAARGEQPVLDDSGYETALILALVLAEHEASLALPEGPDGDGG